MDGRNAGGVSTPVRGDTQAGSTKNGLPLFLFGAVVAIVIALAAFPGPPPTHDGPQHVALGYLSRHLADGVNPRFLIANRTLSGFAFDASFGALEAALGWKNAFRCVTLLGASLWASGVWAVARARGSSSPWACLAVALAFPWHFYMGFYSFWLASGASLWVVALAIRVPVDRSGRRALVGVASLALACLHVFPALIAGGAIALLGFFGAPDVPRAKRALGVALAIVPAWVWAVVTVYAVKSDAGYEAEASSTWLSAIQQLSLIGDTLGAGPSLRTMPIALVAIAGAVLAVVRGRTVDRALGVYALVLIALTVVLPFHLAEWFFFSPRFLLFGAALGLLLLPERLVSSRVERVLAPVLAASALAYAIPFHRALRDRAAPLLAGLVQPVPPRGRTLPIILDLGLGDIAHASPFVQLGQLYLVEQGGMNPYLFASKKAVHPILYRAPLEDLFPEPPPAFIGKKFGAGDVPLPAERAWLAALASKYDDVILFGKTDEDVEAFLSFGFKPDFRQGRLLLARYEGCKIDLRRTRATGEPTTFSYAFWPLVEPAGEVVVPADTDRATVSVPCGRVNLALQRPKGSRKACLNWPGGTQLTGTMGPRTRITCELE